MLSPVARFTRFTAVRRGTATCLATKTAHPFFPVTRPMTLTSVRTMSSAWDDQPAPPRLPPEEQAEFEMLVRKARESAAAASLADAVAEANAKAEAKAAAAAAAAAKEAQEAEAVAAAAAAAVATAAATETATATAQETGTSTTTSSQTPSSALNGNPIEGVWRGAPPEFDGERNPKTGEVGGPKNEPLRWGSSGDWSFNGRVTDF
ncbi:hypothetical protein SEPCBS57363_000119 [Sporothrix epigloea]|uniref:Succinate dehydrogenase assembly factor 4, mitochondrial n=1 Tax=Sporothrix epigloea TaxID=1892477 RepID=A0ABP0D5E7_9PEZI